MLASLIRAYACPARTSCVACTLLYAEVQAATQSKGNGEDDEVRVTRSTARARAGEVERRDPAIESGLI